MTLVESGMTTVLSDEELRWVFRREIGIRIGFNSLTGGKNIFQVRKAARIGTVMTLLSANHLDEIKNWSEENAIEFAKTVSGRFSQELQEWSKLSGKLNWQSPRIEEMEKVVKSVIESQQVKL